MVAANTLLLLGSFATAAIAGTIPVEKRTGTASTVTTNLPGSWTYYGCYSDSPSRTLQGATYSNSTSMTEESCVNFCNAGGYVYAGLEYGDECYCGNALIDSTTEPESDCYMPCAGNSTEVCGAGYMLSVFWSGACPSSGPETYPGDNGWKIVGCYTDSTTSRTLPYSADVVGGPSNMTVDGCTTACGIAGYDLAGVEYGRQCWCGNHIALSGQKTRGYNSCNMLCTGDQNEYCGAGNFLDVYASGLALLELLPAPLK